MVHTYDDLPNWVVDYFEPTLFWISVGLLVIVTLIFYKQYKNNTAGKEFIFGLLVFSSCFMVARTIENYRLFYMAEDRQNIFKGWIGLGPEIAGLELVFRVLYYVFSWISIATFYYVTEKHVFKGKTKFTFMVSSIFEGIVSIALYFTEGDMRNLFQIFATIGFLLCAVAPILLYFNMSLKSTGVVRQSCILATLGLALFVAGVMASLPEASYITWWVTGEFLDAYLIAVFAPIAMMIGGFLLVIGYNKMFSGLF
jgi:hypothetical protein